MAGPEPTVSLFSAVPTVGAVPIALALVAKGLRFSRVCSPPWLLVESVLGKTSLTGWMPTREAADLQVLIFILLVVGAIKALMAAIVVVGAELGVLGKVERLLKANNDGWSL